MLHRFCHVETVVRAVRAGNDGMVEVPGHGELVAGVGKWVVVAADGRLTLLDHGDFVRDYAPADATARAYLEAMNR